MAGIGKNLSSYYFAFVVGWRGNFLVEDEAYANPLGTIEAYNNLEVDTSSWADSQKASYNALKTVTFTYL
jgi:hypothetical protein